MLHHDAICGWCRGRPTEMYICQNRSKQRQLAANIRPTRRLPLICLSLSCKAKQSPHCPWPTMLCAAVHWSGLLCTSEESNMRLKSWIQFKQIFNQRKFARTAYGRRNHLTNLKRRGTSKIIQNQYLWPRQRPEQFTLMCWFIPRNGFVTPSFSPKLRHQPLSGLLEVENRIE